MICATKMFSRIALLAILAIGIYGCAEPKKPVDAKADAKAAATTESSPAAATAAEATPAPAAADAKPADGKVLLGSPELTAGIPGEGPLKLAELEAWLNDPRNHEPLDFELPFVGRQLVVGFDPAGQRDRTSLP